MRVNHLQSCVELYPYKHTAKSSKAKVTSHVDRNLSNERLSNPVHLNPFFSFKGVYSKNIPLTAEEKTVVLKTLKDIKQNGNEHKNGSIGDVYKVNIPTRDYPLAIKEYKQFDTARNAKQEARSLIKIPKDCNRTQKYLGIISDGENIHLISTYMEGDTLSKYKDNMSDEQIENILDELYKIDKGGIVYYDYGMANIVTDGKDVKFFDFEVNKEQSFTKQNKDAEGDLCHQARNPYFTKLSNVSAFEIRTVGKIVGELEKYPDGDDRSTDFVERYLKQLSKYYKRTSNLYEQSSEKEGSQMSPKAVKYEKNLAKIFEDPCEEVVNIEKQRMRINELLTEYHYRNDPDLDHDDKLYKNLPKFIDNMRDRFSNIQNDLSTLYGCTLDKDIEEYCDVNAEYMSKLEHNYLDNYLVKKAEQEKNK